MLIEITLFYIIVVLQHLYFQLYFKNKTSSTHSSSINGSESLSDSSSLRIEFKMSFDCSSYIAFEEDRKIGAMPCAFCSLY